jgi:hypothetical protein
VGQPIEHVKAFSSSGKFRLGAPHMIRPELLRE